MRARILPAAVAGIVLLAGPAYAVPPATDCHGVMVDDALGDQYIVTNLNSVARPTKAIDVDEVFLTGAAGSEKLNLRVDSLRAVEDDAPSQNTEYAVQWDDHVFGGGYTLELTARFLTADGAAGAGTYSLWRYRPDGSFYSVVNGTGRTFVDDAGVIQWDKPTSFAWPATFTGLQVHAEQYETNVFLLTDNAIRMDTASATSWTQPC